MSPCSCRARVPDLPGCFSAGDTLDEAIEPAREAIACHIEGLLMDGEPIPARASLEAHQANDDYRDGVWAIVAVDISKLSSKTRRANITLPERGVGHRGSSGRSRRTIAFRTAGFRAALSYVQRQSGGTLPVFVTDRPKRSRSYRAGRPGKTGGDIPSEAPRRVQRLRSAPPP